MTATTAQGETPVPTPPANRPNWTTGQVLRFFWRALVGIKDALVLLFMLLFFGILFTLLAGRPNSAAYIGDGALLLRLDGTVSEQPAPADPLAALSGNLPLREFRRDDIVRALEAAAGDDRVKAVVLDLDRFMGGGQVALGDIAEALDKVRAARKPVLAYATGYSDDAYQLAAHASEVWTEPGGGGLIAGPGGNRLYYKGLLDNIGINTHIYRVGTYKSFVEPFTRADQSPEAREATNAYLSVLWSRWQDGVRRARPRANLDAMLTDPAAAIRAAGGDSAEAARRAGLVDRIGSRLDFDRRVAEIVGSEDDARPWDWKRIRLSAYVDAHPIEENGTPIAVIPVVGDIVDGKAPAGTAGGETIAAHILDAVADEDVKAIVLRVDSPGGSVLASERIRTALLQAKARRLPIVVSMANVAASGGFWVSTPADRIFAEPDTITGSIGVFAIIPSFERVLGRYGITSDGVTTTPLSGQPDVTGGTNAAFDALAQASVDNIYARFTNLVATSRHMPVERLRTIAEGRVWAGADARQNGLIDAFGGMPEAMAEAARLARIDPAETYPRYFEDGPDPFSEMLQKWTDDGGDEAQDARAPVGWLAQSAWARQAWTSAMIADLQRMVRGGGVEASCLSCAGFLPPRAPRAEDEGLMLRWLGLAG